MKKRISSLILALVLLLTVALPGISGFAAESTVTIKLHYHRPDGKYDGWDVWMWGSADGKGVPLVEEGGEMVATYEVAPGDISIGFIVRKGNWEQKDWSEDQFIDIVEMISGTVHVYVESGVKGYTKKYAPGAVTGIQVANAKYDGATTVAVTMSEAIKGDPAKQLAVEDIYGTPVEIAGVTAASETVYHVNLKEALDDMGSYVIIFDGKETCIMMPDFYGTAKFENAYTYKGNDLGANWSKESTTFRVWAPTAASVKVNLYKSGVTTTSDLIKRVDMEKDVNGTWVATVEGDLHGTYYTYLVDIGGEAVEASDPYARTAGVNGKKSMVIDLDSTNPEGWENDKNPNAGMNITDAIIYELHVRDLSIDESSGIHNAGKFLGLTEKGTTNSQGLPTGLDHMVNLGITHLHLLPIYDYGSVDEKRLDKPQFNWGYDPVNYNVPEGSYSTDPYKGEVRVNEMKQMVKALHDNGISVIMDVVYNHVYNAGAFCFNQIVPNYFSRVSASGVYSNGSGCGNDTASERAMVKKYIVDSVKYWADEYHIDGFRFDLVGLIDTQTINEVMAEVSKDHPDVIFYGEGWTMSTKMVKDGYTLTTQANASKTPGFAFFNDGIRDAIKGSVFDATSKGYVSGATALETKISQAFKGQSMWSGKACPNPIQTINYASCHDNYTLFDKIVNSTPDSSRADQIKMNNLSAAIYMMSQGVPFIHAGEELLRTKVKDDGTFEHNSYSSSDEVNCFKWEDLNKEEYQKVLAYYQGLIAFRKAHPALRLTTTAEVNANVTALSGLAANVTAFKINGGINGEKSDGLFVAFNPNKTATTVTLPAGNWNIYINGEKAGTEVLGSAQGTVTVAPISTVVLVKEAAPAGGNQVAPDAQENLLPWILGGALAGVALVAVLAVILKKKGQL